MNGVEILTSAQVAIDWAFNWDAFWITAIIVFFILFVAGIFCSCDEMDFTPLVVFSAIGVAMGGLFGTVMGGTMQTPTAHETQYKVTISDEVPMTQFYEHYEVIEQDGKIFTVRETVNEE
jgi:hypothetical protein